MIFFLCPPTYIVQLVFHILRLPFQEFLKKRWGHFTLIGVEEKDSGFFPCSLIQIMRTSSVRWKRSSYSQAKIVWLMKKRHIGIYSTGRAQRGVVVVKLALYCQFLTERNLRWLSVIYWCAIIYYTAIYRYHRIIAVVVTAKTAKLKYSWHTGT